MSQMVAAELKARQGTGERLARWLALGTAAALIALAAAVGIEFRLAAGSTPAVSTIVRVDGATVEGAPQFELTAPETAAPQVDVTKPVYDRSDLLLSEG